MTNGKNKKAILSKLLENRAVLFGLSLIHLYATLLFIRIGLAWVGGGEFSLGTKEAFGYSMGFGVVLGLAAGIMAVFDRRFSWWNGLFCGLLIGFASGVSGVIFFDGAIGLAVALTSILSCILVFDIFFFLAKMSRIYEVDDAT